jgi:hypothetical protein
MRDSLFWSAGWGRRVAFEGAMHQEETRRVFEDYKLDINLKEEPELENGFGVFLPLRFSHRPMPSPDYRVYPKEFRAGIGFRLNLTDARRYLIRGEGVLENVQRNDYGATTDFDNLLGARVSVHARYYYQKGFYQFLEASAGTLEKGAGEADDERSSAILFGVGLGEAGH